MKHLKSLLLTCLVSIVVISCQNNAEQQKSPFSSESAADKGGKLFKSKCAMCHAINTDIAGPALKDVIARWDNDTTNLKSFIKDSQEMVKSGEPHAVATYEKYKTTMPSFPSFTDEELSQLIAFLKN